MIKLTELQNDMIFKGVCCFKLTDAHSVDTSVLKLLCSCVNRNSSKSDQAEVFFFFDLKHGFNKSDGNLIPKFFTLNRVLRTKISVFYIVKEKYGRFNRYTTKRVLTGCEF